MLPNKTAQIKRNRSHLFTGCFCLLVLLAIAATFPRGMRVSARSDLKSSARDATENPWQEIAESNIPNQKDRVGRPRAYRVFRLAALSSAPLEFTAAAPGTISLPLADGSFSSFYIVESPIMEPALAKRFPEIKTYRVISAVDSTVSGRIGWTLAGFHGILFTPHGTVLVEPYAQGERKTISPITKVTCLRPPSTVK
jgi:hypothetical protein